MSETSDPHLADDVLAAYLDRSLPPIERRAANAHLSECAACREELVAIATLLRRRTAPRRWLRFGAPAGALAAAGILFLLLARWRPSSGPGAPADDRLRETARVGSVAAAVAVVAPAEGGTVPADRVTFVWRPVGTGGTYLLRLADTASVRWTIDTADTTVILPDSVRLERGSDYHWWVDALTADGRSVTTGVRRFRTAR